MPLARYAHAAPGLGRLQLRKISARAMERSSPSSRAACVLAWQPHIHPSRAAHGLTASGGADAASQHGGGALDMLISFDLPPGAYATMALREVVKPEVPPSQHQHIRFDTMPDGEAT